MVLVVLRRCRPYRSCLIASLCVIGGLGEAKETKQTEEEKKSKRKAERRERKTKVNPKQHRIDGRFLHSECSAKTRKGRPGKHTPWRYWWRKVRPVHARDLSIVSLLFLFFSFFFSLSLLILTYTTHTRLLPLLATAKRLGSVSPPHTSIGQGQARPGRGDRGSPRLSTSRLELWACFESLLTV